MEEVKLGVRENLTGKIDIVLVDLLYNVWRDQNDAHAGFDVFGLNNMKNMFRLLRDVMRPGVFEHVFSSALQFGLQYTAPALKQKKASDSSKEGSG